MLAKLVECKDYHLQIQAKYVDHEAGITPEALEKDMRGAIHDKINDVCVCYEDLEFVQFKSKELIDNLTLKITQVKESISDMRSKNNTLFDGNLRTRLQAHLLDSDGQCNELMKLLTKIMQLDVDRKLCMDEFEEIVAPEVLDLRVKQGSDEKRGRIKDK